MVTRILKNAVFALAISCDSAFFVLIPLLPSVRSPGAWSWQGGGCLFPLPYGYGRNISGRASLALAPAIGENPTPPMTWAAHRHFTFATECLPHPPRSAAGNLEAPHGSRPATILPPGDDGGES
jgi:hypothetical protein